MRIAICTNHYLPSNGGCERVTSELANSLHDHDVFVFTRRILGRNHKDFDYSVVEYIPGDTQHFANKLNKAQPDLVLIYSDVFDFMRYVVKQVTKPRVMIALCGANYLYGHKNYATQFHRQSHNIEALICHSTHDRDYRFCCNDILQNKVSIIPNAVHLEEFDSNEISKEFLAHKYGLDVNLRWILSVANFFPGKGQEDMIDIVQSFKYIGNFQYIQLCSDTEFAISNHLIASWKKKVYTSRIGNAHLLENVPREDVVAFFKASNLFASTSEKEVAPLVILEAMAAQTPWVSFDVGNIRGLKGGRFVACRKNRDYHCVVGLREIRMFYQHLSDLWNLSSLGDIGRKQIEAEMTWEIVLPQYRKLIEK